MTKHFDNHAASFKGFAFAAARNFVRDSKRGTSECPFANAAVSFDNKAKSMRNV